jgi:hypothetical protein
MRQLHNEEAPNLFLLLKNIKFCQIREDKKCIKYDAKFHNSCKFLFEKLERKHSFEKSEIYLKGKRSEVVD